MHARPSPIYINVQSSDDEAHARVQLTCANGRESRQFDGGQQIVKKTKYTSQGLLLQMAESAGACAGVLR